MPDHYGPEKALRSLEGGSKLEPHGQRRMYLWEATLH